MYYTFIDLLSVLFSLVMLRYTWTRLLYFLQIFQQNGYKPKEYWPWLRDQWEKKVVTPELVIFNIVLFVFVLVLPWFDIEVNTSAIALLFFITGIYWYSNVSLFKADRVKKPLVFTSRMKRLFVPVFIFSFFPVAWFVSWSYTGLVPFIWVSLSTYQAGFLSFDVTLLVFGWVFAAVLVPFTLFPAAWLTKPIETFIQNGFKKQAREKIASMPHLKVIAITGSYGKTSTKFMIRDILKERFQVCSTPGSYNTPMGICKVINNDLQAHHQILILEMGARYPGNIQELCDIARPDISVVTNVGLAHLETFGSQQVIAREKGKLVDNLPDGGVAVLNADDPLVKAMGRKRDDIETIYAGLQGGDIQAGTILYDTSGSHFNISFGDEKLAFETRLLGAHNVHNMLLAVAVGKHLGLRAKTMSIAAKHIEPVEHRLELKKQGDLFIIDDAFNSNPVGAKNAVEILSQFKSGRRIIITPGMVELGEIEYEENKKFGEVIGQAKLDLVILVGKERAKPILEGLENASNGSSEHVRVVQSLFEANDIVKNYAGSGDVILYENDLPDLYNE